MFPRRFIDLYGVPRFLPITLGVGAHFDFPADPDRYLLWFIGANSQFQVNPLLDGQPTSGGVVVGNTPDSNLKITHAIDGAAVNLGYRVTSPLGANVVLVLEGHMRSRSAAKLGRKSRGSSVTQTDSRYGDRRG